MNLPTGCICATCHSWHSHVYPDPRKPGKNICINCKRDKENKGGYGDGRIK